MTSTQALTTDFCFDGARKTSLDQLAPVIYGELRRLAGGIFRNQAPGQTLQATALVHEAYVRLAEYPGLAWRNRSHFFGIVARCMREVMVDHARTRGAAKRGGGLEKVELDNLAAIHDESRPEILDLDRALSALAAMDERKARVVELRFFCGLTTAEIADTLNLSTATVDRDLRVAQAWLHHQLSR